MKAVFFDFDGTLTKSEENIWRKIWQYCGYDIGEGSYYKTIFNDFFKKKITYQKWCNLTCDKFKSKCFNKSTLMKFAEQINLMDGFEEFVKALVGAGFELHILSGNLVSVISYVLGDSTKYFSSINGNEFKFDENGIISHIIGTNYDCEGKAGFITEYMDKFGAKAEDLTFVGNGNNDDWAYLSGCRTICINPDNADHTNNTKWHIVEDNVSNLMQLLKYFV